MPKFRVSQAEKWHRVYEVEAPNLDEAKRIYEEQARDGTYDLAEEIDDPEYVEDIIEDQEWWEVE